MKEHEVPTEAQVAKAAAAKAKRKAKRQEKAMMRSVLRDACGDDMDFYRVMVEDYHLKG